MLLVISSNESYKKYTVEGIKDNCATFIKPLYTESKRCTKMRTSTNENFVEQNIQSNVTVKQSTLPTTNRPSKSQRIQTIRPWRFQKPKESTWNVKKSKTLTFQVTDYKRTKSSIILRKKSNETLEHCLCKAILWALHVEKYGPMNIGVEWDIGDTYLPDVVAFPHVQDGETQKTVIDELENKHNNTINNNINNYNGQKFHAPPRNLSMDTKTKPLFWGESGRMSPKKAADLCRRFPDTHIVHMRWGMDGGVQHEFVNKVWKKIKPTLLDRRAPFHVVTVDGDPRRFFDEEGNIFVTKNDFEWKELKLDS